MLDVIVKEPCIHFRNNTDQIDSDNLITPLPRKTQYAFVTFVGLAVPSLILGRAVMAVVTAAAVIAAIYVVDRPRLYRDFTTALRTPAGVLILVTIAAWLPAIALSLRPVRSAEVLAWLAPFIMFAVAVWSLLRTDRTLVDGALKSVLLGTIVFVSLGLSPILGPSEIFSFYHLEGWVPTRAALYLKDEADAGMLLLPVVLMAAARFGGRWRVLGICEAAALLALIALTNSKASLAGLLAMALVASAIAARSSPHRKAWVVALVATLLATVAAVVWLKVTQEWETPAPSLDAKLYLPHWLVDFNRQLIWKFAFEKFLQFPWFGVGPNTINFTEGANRIIQYSSVPFMPSHPHNWALEILAETGIVGFVPTLATVVVVTVVTTHLGLRRYSGAALAAVAVHWGYWTSGLFNFSYWSAWWQLTYFLLMAICLASHVNEAGPSPEIADRDP